MAHFTIIILIIFFVPLMSKRGHCAYSYSNQQDYTAFTTYYTHFHDMSKSAGDADKSISPVIEIEAGLRFQSLFQIIVVGATSASSNANDTNRESIGVGLRVDTPGVFWLGDVHRQKNRAVKNFPVNTSIFAYLQRASNESSSGAVSTAIGSNMGITLDIFLFNDYVYFSTQASILNQDANTYSTSSFGIGANF